MQNFAIISVALLTQPQDGTTVTLTAAGSDDGHLSTSPAFVTFTKYNWFTPQSLTASCLDDTIIQGGPYASSLGFTLTTADSQYSLLGGTLPTLNLTVADNDLSSVSVTLGIWGGVLCPATPPTGAILVSVPPGALNGTTELTAALLEAQPAAGKANGSDSGRPGKRVSGTYILTPHSTTFNVPISIAIQVSERARGEPRRALSFPPPLPALARGFAGRPLGGPA